VFRKILGIKKVGFSGTLDPLATGLLILATGRATKLLDCFHFLPKVYEAEIIFGATSPTYDLEGEVSRNKDAKEFDKDYLKTIVQKFLGKQKQRAPIFSAKKIDGQKLHKLARQGKKVEAPVKEIEMYDLKILDFAYPKLKLEVKCSAGTYIRSLAHDLGEATGQGALLSGLRRTAIGDFLVSKAVKLEDLNEDNIEKYRIPTQDAITSLNQQTPQ
jgi:tRNA pseudouridine55 synthase